MNSGSVENMTVTFSLNDTSPMLAKKKNFKLSAKVGSIINKTACFKVWFAFAGTPARTLDHQKQKSG